MSEENNPQTDLSKSAISGTSTDIRIRRGIGNKIQKPNNKQVGNVSRKSLKATTYGHSLAILVSKKLIGNHSQRTDVFEIIITRAFDPSREFALYTTHLPGYKHAYLDLFQLSPTHGEKFWVKAVRPYGLADFARDYRASRPVGLENTNLEERMGRLTLSIGGKELNLRNMVFRTYQGKVVLDARLEDVGEIKIQKKIGSFEMRLRDHSRVLSVESIGDDILTTYARTEDNLEHRRILGWASGTTVKNDQRRDTIRLRGKFWISSRSTRDAFEVVCIDADDEGLAFIRDTLSTTPSIERFRRVKGDIAEQIVGKLAGQLGMMIIAEHPHNQDAWRIGSERTGPDLLVEVGQTDKWYYVEIKWWDFVPDAIEAARRQATDDLARFPTYNGRKVSGSLVSVLDWKVDTKNISLLLAEATRV